MSVVDIFFLLVNLCASMLVWCLRLNYRSINKDPMCEKYYPVSNIYYSSPDQVKPDSEDFESYCEFKCRYRDFIDFSAHRSDFVVVVMLNFIVSSSFLSINKLFFAVMPFGSFFLSYVLYYVFLKRRSWYYHFINYEDVEQQYIRLNERLRSLMKYKQKCIYIDILCYEILAFQIVGVLFYPAFCSIIYSK